MKKMVSLVLTFALLFTMSVSVFAESATVQSSSTDENKNASFKYLTKTEYINRLSEVEKISIEEATKIANSHETSNGDVSINSLGPGQYYAEFYITENCGMGFTVEVGALCVVASGGGHSNFVSIDSSWSKATGSGNYTWDYFYKKAEKSSDNTTLSLMSRGNLEVAVSSSISASMQANFIAASFSCTGTVGSTTYFRKTVSISGIKVLH